MADTNASFIQQKTINFFAYLLAIESLSEKARGNVEEAKKTLTIEAMEAFVKKQVAPYIGDVYNLTNEWCKYWEIEADLLSKDERSRIALYLNCFNDFFMSLE